MDARNADQDTLVDWLFRAYEGTTRIRELPSKEPLTRSFVLVSTAVREPRAISADRRGYHLRIVAQDTPAAETGADSAIRSWSRTPNYDDTPTRIVSATFTNFRRFDFLDITPGRGMNVLIGRNGRGKTTTLDALAMALSQTFRPLQPRLSGDVEYGALALRDIRLKRYEKNGIPKEERQLPASIQVDTEVLGSRGQSILLAEPFGTGGVATGRGAIPLLEFTDILRSAVQENFDTTLPLLAYYRTNRVWNGATKETSESVFASRLAAYEGCLDPPGHFTGVRSWFQRMELLALQDGRTPPVLEASKRALQACLEGCDLIRYDARLDDLAARFADTGVLLGFDQLSDGQRNMLGMVADMAYRAAMLNPHLGAEAPQKTPGIVLIDEIDLHLHPAWQRRVIADLTRVFPKVQFIVTTHSPQILAEVPKESILILEDSGAYSPAAPTEGRDSNAILREILKVNPRPEAVAAELSRVSEMLDDGEITKARELLDSLAERLTERDPDVNRLRVLLDVTERIDAGDHEGA